MLQKVGGEAHWHSSWIRGSEWVIVSFYSWLFQTTI